MPKPFKIGVVGSTGGSVFSTAFRDSKALAGLTSVVLSDRECGIVDFARSSNLPVFIAERGTNLEVSNSFLETLKNHECDIVLSFYTRLFEGEIISFFSDRFFNFHPSLLPRHPGIGAFERSVAFGDDLIGSTVHTVESSADVGRTIMQTSISNPRDLPVDLRRHLIFKIQVSQLVYLAETCEALFTAKDKGI
jgi:folate-dependent phosphoribosylglycinamide formyltransferase PurN